MGIEPKGLLYGPRIQQPRRSFLRDFLGWRKRRLRLAEAATHRPGLDGTPAPYRETVKPVAVRVDW